MIAKVNIIGLTMIFLLGANVACNSTTKYDEHERICREQGRVEVYDQQSWDRYQRFLADRRDEEGFSKNDGVSLSSGNGYDFRFGDDLRFSRPSKSPGLEREDVTILFDGSRIARLIDFVLVIENLGSRIDYSCVSRFPDIYFTLR